MTLVAALPALPRWLRSVLSGRSSPVRGPGADGPAAINELYHSRRLSLVRLAVLMVDDPSVTPNSDAWRQHSEHRC